MDLVDEDSLLSEEDLKKPHMPPALCSNVVRQSSRLGSSQLSSALSAASSACDHIRDWVCGTPEGTWVSMGVYSDGSYNVPAGLIYSFPVTCCNGEWTIVQVIFILVHMVGDTWTCSLLYVIFCFMFK